MGCSHHHHGGHDCGHGHAPDHNRLMEAPHVAVIGLGLMGASFAAALKQADAAGLVTGYDRDAEAAAYCLKQGYIHHAAASAAAAVKDADIVMLAVPVDALAAAAESIAPHLGHGTVVTDLSSVKRQAVVSVLPHLPVHAVLVPGHPIAGGSTHGAKAARADLFEGKLAVLTPEKDVTPPYAIAAIARLWEAAGCHTERMSPENHDIIYAYVSHLPQLMAYAACHVLAEETAPLPPAAPESFRRFIRLGGSDAALWTEIAMANQEPVRHALAHALATLEHLLQEFAAGEAHGAASQDNPHVAIRYFPLLAAGAAISVVNQFEMQNNLRLAHYAGTGFRDFTSPVADDPSKDFEAISECYAHVARCLRRYIDLLRDFHLALGDTASSARAHLSGRLAECQTRHAMLQARLVDHAA